MFRGYVLLGQDRIQLFTPSEKITTEVEDHLHSQQCSNASCVQWDDLLSLNITRLLFYTLKFNESIGLHLTGIIWFFLYPSSHRIFDYEVFEDSLQALEDDPSVSTVLVNPAGSSYFIYNTVSNYDEFYQSVTYLVPCYFFVVVISFFLQKNTSFFCWMIQISSAKRITGSSPIINLKAIKNPVEIQGMRNAHLKDAVALCDFLALLESEVSSIQMLSIKTTIEINKFNGG